MLRKFMDTEDQGNQIGPFLLSVVVSVVVAVIGILLML